MLARLLPLALGTALCSCQAAPAPPKVAPPVRQDSPSGARNAAGDVGAGRLSIIGENGCFVATDQRVRCWGKNDRGQLGQGDRAEHWGAVVVRELDGARAVSVSVDFACAVALDGSVWCWGDNAAGQLGADVGAESAVPVRVPGVRDATSVSVGAFGGACARSKDASVTCWGKSGLNEARQPALVAGLRGAADVALGLGGGCALLADGSVRCWGHYFGGDGGGAAVAVDGLGKLVSIASGAISQHVCGIDDQGTARCWGRHGHGHLDGRPFQPGTPDFAVGKPLIELGPVSSISAGVEHSCARTRSDEVWCWGQPHRFALKKEELEPRPRRVEGLSGALALSAGHYQTCIIGRGLDVECWGELEPERFGASPPSPSRFSRRVPELRGVVDVAAGRSHACAALTDGSVWCWGANHARQLGSDEPWRSYSPLRVAGLTGARSVSCAGDYCAAILGDGSVVDWGALSGTAPSAVAVVDRGPAAALALSDELSCRVLRDGRARCGGRDLPFPGRVAELAVDARVVCARTAEGRVFCLGFSHEKPLLPRAIQKLPRAVALRGTQWAEVEGGKRFGWGLGDEAMEESEAHAPLAADAEYAGARKTVRSTTHHCTLFEDGTVGCWGEAWSGALGVGYEPPRPVRVELAR